METTVEEIAPGIFRLSTFYPRDHRSGLHVQPVPAHGRRAVAAESFWATMKVEFYDRYLWPTRAAAKLAVGDWIERVYNRRRRHSALGMISPVEYENRFIRRHKPLTLCPPNGVKPNIPSKFLAYSSPSPVSECSST
jgi:Integrase core domain